MNMPWVLSNTAASRVGLGITGISQRQQTLYSLRAHLSHALSLNDHNKDKHR